MLGFRSPHLPREARLRYRYAEGLEQAVARAGKRCSLFSAVVPALAALAALDPYRR